MTPPAESAAGGFPAVSARLRALPSVDELLSQPAIVALVEKAGRESPLMRPRNAFSMSCARS